MAAAERIEREMKDVDLEMESAFEEMERMVTVMETRAKDARRTLSQHSLSWVIDAQVYADDVMRIKTRIDQLKAKRDLLSRLHTDLFLV